MLRQQTAGKAYCARSSARYFAPSTFSSWSRSSLVDTDASRLLVCSSRSHLVTSQRFCSTATADKRQQRQSAEFDGHTPITSLLFYGCIGFFVLYILSWMLGPDSWLSALFGGIGHLINTLLIIIGWVFGF